MAKNSSALFSVARKNYPALGILAVAVLFLIFTAYQDALARFVWQKYRWSQAAIFLIRNDADLAMFIGNYYFNGVIGSKEYNLDIAEIAFEKAVGINQKILWGHYQLARIYFIKKDYSRALDEISGELKYNPQNLRSLYVRGLIYGYRNQGGDLEKAESDFRRFTQWAPKEWAGYNDLAWILSKEKKYAEAEKVIKKYFGEIKEAGSNPWLWNSLGVAQLNIKKYSDAIYSFTKAKELAGGLTAKDWVRAYPGNNPSTGGAGLSAFLKAISENLNRAESKK